ncbi:MAG: DUF3857 domain-containing protein [Elusimicrobiota bacterium]|nr:DUF3857 domain-containing protein [Elusimicrobiota bacterium]
MKKYLILFSALVFSSGVSAAGNIGELEADHKNINSDKLLLLQKIEKFESAGTSDELLKFKAGFLFESGDFEGCIETLKKVRETDYQVNRLFALSHYYTGEPTAALYHFDTVAKEAENLKDGEILFYRARTLEAKNLFEDAVTAYGKVREGAYAVKAAQRSDALVKKLPRRIEDIDSEIAAMIRKAPSQEEHPEAAAAVLLEREVYEVFPDSSTVSEVLKVVKIFNDRGKKQFAEVRLSYDSTYEDIEIVDAYTVLPSGLTREVSPQQIRDVSKYMNFPLYSNARLKIISMPAVTPGAVIVYRVRYKSNKLASGNVIFRYGIQGFSPYVKQEFTVKIPLSFTPNIRIFRNGYLKKYRLKPRVKKLPSGRTYKWKVPPVPEIIPEDSMPSWNEITDGFRFSTFGSWKQIYLWWKGMFSDRTVVTPAIRKQTAKLMDMSSERKTAANIYHWVASEIRYVAVEYGEAGFRPHKAEEIFLNKYGDCKDQAVLLTTMLREAGLNAHLVLIGTRGTFPLIEDFPELVFNHAIACVEIDGKIIFMDPTAETCSFGDLPGGDQGRKTLVFFDGRYEIMETPVFGSASNSVSKKMTIKVADDEKISASRDVETKGVFDQGQRYWLKYTKPVKIKEQLEKKVNAITPDAVLKKYELPDVDNMNEHCRLKMIFRGRDYLKKAGNIRLAPQWGGVGTSIVSKEKRKYPIKASLPSEKITETKLVLPPSWKVLFIPEEINEENKWFSLSRKFVFTEGNELIYTEKTVTNNEDVKPEDYKKYRGIVLGLHRRTRSQAVFETMK